MTLNRNPENFFAQIEQAAFSPGNTVPGIGLSPDKMLLGRAFAYNDAQRNRIGTNFHQLPVNRPKVPVNTYMFDGQMTYQHSGNAPVYAPNSGGRPWADETGAVADGWEADGEMVRSAYTLRADDDDFGQPGILVREVFDDAQRQAAGRPGRRQPAGRRARAGARARLRLLEAASTPTSVGASRRRCVPAARRNRPKAWASAEAVSAARRAADSPGSPPTRRASSRTRVRGAPRPGAPAPRSFRRSSPRPRAC